MDEGDEALMDMPSSFELMMLKVVMEGKGTREGLAVGVPLRCELVRLRVRRFVTSRVGVGEVEVRLSRVQEVKEMEEVENAERRPRGEEKKHWEKEREEGEEGEAEEEEGEESAATAEEVTLLSCTCIAPVVFNCTGDFVALVE